jgi:DNA processing protein
LYYKGNPEVLNPQRSIAIVGTRQMTDYGRVVTEQIVAQLKTFNCVCISGLAYGIDICAHKASVQYQIPTIGVMANGIDKVYPSQHKQTAIQMQQLGGVMSEHPLV